MNRGEIREKVSRALDALGETPEEIAETLKKAEVKGVRFNPRACPVAMYLNREVNEGYEFSMAGIYIACYKEREEIVQITSYPHHVRTFAVQFDAKEYPDLEAT